MSTEIVDLHVTYTEAEIVSAIRYSYRQTYRIITRAAVSFAVLVAGILGATVRPDIIMWYALLFGGGLVFALHVLAYSIGPRKRLRENPKLMDAYRVTFSEQQIVFKTVEIQSQVRWSYYRGWWESLDFYFLTRDEKGFTLIPKRAFSDGEQESNFRRMLKSHLGKGLKAGNRSAERVIVDAEYVPKSLEPPDWR